MSDIHVLSTESRGKVSVIMHFAVPDATNAVGVNWRVALVNSGRGGSSLMTEGAGDGQITSGEKTQVESGEVYEHRATFSMESAGTDLAVQRAELLLLYAKRKTEVIAKMQKRLKYFGHTEDES